MATIEYGMADGMRYVEDPRTGATAYTIIAHVKDLAPVAGGFGSAGEELALINEALYLMPPRGTPGPIDGTFLVNRDPEPYPPCDCIVRLNFGADPYAVRLNIGTIVSLEDTEFDAANRALAWNLRVPISVTYDPSVTVPTPTDNNTQGGTVPYYANKSTASFERLIDYNPGPDSQRFAACTNSALWLGIPVGQALCMGITGESDAQGNYVEHLDFAYDPHGFRRVFRWVDPKTGRPPRLSATQVSNYNGINEITVQGADDFNYLGLYVP